MKKISEKMTFNLNKKILSILELFVESPIYIHTMLVCTLFTRQYVIGEYFLSDYILQCRTRRFFTDYFFMYSCSSWVLKKESVRRLQFHFRTKGYFGKNTVGVPRNNTVYRD